MGYVEMSTRISIRWLPDPASEPTITTVLNVGTWFIDLRVLKEGNPPLLTENHEPGSTFSKTYPPIDWAMAGERKVLSENPLKCQWIHHIDSNSAHPAPDEASFSKLPNGDDLEVGTMPCPTKNDEPTPYEEVWRVIPPAKGTKFAWIVRSTRPEDGKMFIGRIGDVMIGLLDGEKGFGAYGLVFEGGQWRENYAQGNSRPFTESAGFMLGRGSGKGEESWKVGMVVEDHFEVLAWELVGDEA